MPRTVRELLTAAIHGSEQIVAMDVDLATYTLTVAGLVRRYFGHAGDWEWWNG